MYKIGDFSKITNLTKKALRYYDEQGILKPSYRAENEYRLYDESDYEKALLIIQLKGFDFSIAEIKDALEHCENKEDLSYYLSEKKEFIEKRMHEEKALIRKLEAHLLPNKEEAKFMNYQIEVKEVEPMIVAGIRFKGKYSDVGNYIGEIYKVVKDKAVGAPFNFYYDEDYKEVADIEICVPLKQLVSVANTEISVRKIPGCKGISVIHTGGYEGLNQAYKALIDYANAKSLHLTLPSREIYHKGPGMIFKGNPHKYVTEIIVPFEEV